jgi:zinc D-Ala-D-Ala carboxypeptidase
VSGWEYFDPTVDLKLTCSCGCGRMEMDDDFMHSMDRVRENCGFPFRVTSGFRCPTYNAQVSSTGERGPHTTGRAIDIAAPSSSMRLTIMEAAQLEGFRRFGIAKSFIHLDNLRERDGFPEGIWSY